MGNYPKWWNTTITIYNQYEDPITRVIKWYKTSIDRCFWKHTQDKVMLGDTTISSDYIICRIPENTTFKQGFEWFALPTDEKPNYFTLNVADIIVNGKIDEDINEYATGQRSTDFLNKYKPMGCIQVSQVVINVGGGRNNPHYYIKGE